MNKSKLDYQSDCIQPDIMGGSNQARCNGQILYRLKEAYGYGDIMRARGGSLCPINQEEVEPSILMQKQVGRDQC
jgi:hypothetical protein